MKVIVKGDKKMRKRFNAFWRIAVVLLVVASIASVAIPSGTTQAAIARPNTYMNPIPAYLNGGLLTTGQSVLTPGVISGTSLDAVPVTQRVASVEVQIRRDWDNSYWDDSLPGPNKWVDDAPDTWNSLPGPLGTLIQESTLGWGAFDQWQWIYAPTWTAANFDSGKSYTVRARALDNSLPQGYYDLTPATDTFIYDNQIPDISFDTLFPGSIYNDNLSTISGTAHDDDGALDQVRVQIIQDPLGAPAYWNGFFWQATSIWIKAQGTSGWSISTTTTPPLPKWQNNVLYQVSAQAADKADNRKIEGPLPPVTPFRYRKALIGGTGTTASNHVYVDPLPVASNTLAAAAIFTGTAKAIPLQQIAGVRVELKDVTANAYWDNTVGWSGSTTWANCPPAVVAYSAPYDQWDWTLAVAGLLPAPPTWVQGHKYQIRAQATDNVLPTPNTYNSSTESFTFDGAAAGMPAPSSIDAFDNEVYNSWTSLSGKCQDDMYGKIVAEVVMIQRNSDALYWNGAGWGAVPWTLPNAWDWVFATAMSNSSFNQTKVLWRVTSSTNPALPPLANDVVYTITARSLDWAGNVEATATKIFTFRMDISSGYAVPTATTPPANTGVPTTVPTNTSTTVPTHVATKTPTHVPTKTKVPTATPTTVPGFSGSGTIGTGVGTVVAEDGNGDTRVTATFEAGAFGSNTPVTISGSGNCNAVGAAPSGYSKGNSCFDIEPEGDLDANVEVCVYYTAADENAGGGDPDNLVLAYKDGGTWVILATTVDGDTICAKTDHIGTFAVLGKAAAEGGEWVWWYYLLIGLGALLIVAIIVLILVRPKGAGEGAAEEGYEEEEEI